MPRNPVQKHPRRIQFFLVLDFIGLFIFLLGIQPGLFGLDRSHVIGYVQAIVFLSGLGLVVASSIAAETLLRPTGQAWTIREDIGARLAATGFVFAAVASAADLIGLGTQPLPQAPHFGVLQSIGLLFGVLIVLVGLILYHPGQPKPEPDTATETPPAT
jgi:hypothetical protein